MKISGRGAFGGGSEHLDLDIAWVQGVEDMRVYLVTIARRPDSRLLAYADQKPIHLFLDRMPTTGETLALQSPRQVPKVKRPGRAKHIRTSAHLTATLQTPHSQETWAQCVSAGERHFPGARFKKSAFTKGGMERRNS